MTTDTRFVYKEIKGTVKLLSTTSSLEEAYEFLRTQPDIEYFYLFSRIGRLLFKKLDIDEPETYYIITKKAL